MLYSSLAHKKACRFELAVDLVEMWSVGNASCGSAVQLLDHKSKQSALIGHMLPFKCFPLFTVDTNESKLKESVCIDGTGRWYSQCTILAN